MAAQDRELAVPVGRRRHGDPRCLADDRPIVAGERARIRRDAVEDRDDRLSPPLAVLARLRLGAQFDRAGLELDVAEEPELELPGQVEVAVSGIDLLVARGRLCAAVRAVSI